MYHTDDNRIIIFRYTHYAVLFLENKKDSGYANASATSMTIAKFQAVLNQKN